MTPPCTASRKSGPPVLPRTRPERIKASSTSMATGAKRGSRSFVDEAFRRHRDYFTPIPEVITNSARKRPHRSGVAFLCQFVCLRGKRRGSSALLRFLFPCAARLCAVRGTGRLCTARLLTAHGAGFLCRGLTCAAALIRSALRRNASRRHQGHGRNHRQYQTHSLQHVLLPFSSKPEHTTCPTGLHTTQYLRSVNPRENSLRCRASSKGSRTDHQRNAARPLAKHRYRSNVDAWQMIADIVSKGVGCHPHFIVHVVPHLISHLLGYT